MSHQAISFLKSALRILGYFCIPQSLMVATCILILSEIIGILEEIGH